MSDEVKGGPQTTKQAIENNDVGNINCMKLPRVILTRIDVSKLHVPAVQNSQSVIESKVLKKRSVGRKQKTKTATKQTSTQNKIKNQAIKRDISLKSNNSKAKGKQNILPSVKSSRVSSFSQSPNKNKKTKQTRNNTTAKKNKQVTMDLKKQSPVKIKSDPKFKNFEIEISNPNSTESSEDEFLYDELIEELENTSKAGVSNVKKMLEKTTNIKLKQSSENKAPTIVKGGIIKKTKLPPDLRSVSALSLNPPRPTKRRKVSVGPQLPTQNGSPWKVSPIVKLNKKQSENAISTQKERPPFKPPQPLKPRIGPKQTLKVGPLLNSNTEDNSDEYSEIETLDDDDVSPFGHLNGASCKPTKNKNIPENPDVFNSFKGDEDPNLDLIRILTDDTDDSVKIQPSSNSKTNVDGEQKNTSHKEQSANASTVEMDIPPVRTIYELMNEISMQHPSWNLHIVPETNAFCIVQVTKGRLGIPTMRKCIELDSVNFYGRVYIHQYHIKKFDGLYDSEESILALFQEVHSIKA